MSARVRLLQLDDKYSALIMSAVYLLETRRQEQGDGREMKDAEMQTKVAEHKFARESRAKPQNAFFLWRSSLRLASARIGILTSRRV